MARVFQDGHKACSETEHCCLECLDLAGDLEERCSLCPPARARALSQLRSLAESSFREGPNRWVWGSGELFAANWVMYQGRSLPSFSLKGQSLLTASWTGF